MPGERSPRSRRSPWPASECSRYPATSQAAGSDPCDIYAAAGTPCVAAYSTVGRCTPPTTARSTRFSVPRTVPPPTSASSPPAATGTRPSRTSFCANTDCVSPGSTTNRRARNDLTIEGPGGAAGPDVGANAPRRCRSRPAAKGVRPLHHRADRLPATTAPTGSRSTASPRACTWWPAAPMSTPAAASTSATPRPTADDNGNGTWMRSTSPRYCEFSPCTAAAPGSRPTWRTARSRSQRHQPDDTTSNSDFVTAVLKNNGQTHLCAQRRQRAIRQPDDLLGRRRFPAATRRCIRKARSCSAPAATTATPRSARSSRA